MELVPFSELIQDWFRRRYGRPTEIQHAAWPRVQSGRNCLISAGTGEGKTLAAFMPLIDRLIEDGRQGPVLYVAPLRALANNMADGLGECLDSLCARGGRRLTIGLRTGDTPLDERRRQLRACPDLFLTTPESLFVLLGSETGRRLLSQASAVIVDEIHALATSKRGAHLSLTLERLEGLIGPGKLQRIGLSATARPLSRMAGFLCGRNRPCEIVQADRSARLRVEVEAGSAPLVDVAGQSRWAFVYQRIVDLVSNGGAALVFCNTRALVERVAAELSEYVGDGRVGAHHGSLGLEHRAAIEQGLRDGELKVVVCSSALELGIDVGRLERVCQIGSIDSVSSARQRAGRARHQPGQTPTLHLFPLTLSDLLSAQALLLALERGRLEAPARWECAPADVACQHIIGMAGSGAVTVEEAKSFAARAQPFRKLRPNQIDDWIGLLHDGYAPGRETGQGPIRRGAGGRLFARTETARNSRLNVGTIPEWFDYEVFDLSCGQVLGRLDEEFAFESSPGQIFQLGGKTYCIERIQSGRVEVRPVDSSHAELPFWAGDGAGRSAPLSLQLCRIFGRAERGHWKGIDPQIRTFLERSLAALGCLPGAGRVIVERFPDPGGDEHLVIHAPFGLRVNRAWGLALRKRFCRQFNFELQAVATDNAVLISLGATHSFPLAEIIAYLHSATLEHVVTQAVLDTPQFATRFRWCATTALAILRRTEKGRVLGQVQRNQAENLIARIFPDQLACLENLSGPREVPDHPLVAQALDECLHVFMDLRGLKRLYRRIESGRLEIHTVETSRPSPLAQSVIQAPPTGFLDPAEAEERRTRSFEQPRSERQRHWNSTRVMPVMSLSTAERLEEALQRFVYLPAHEAEKAGSIGAFQRLAAQKIAFSIYTVGRGGSLWVHIDHLGAWLALMPAAPVRPHLAIGMRPLCPEPEEALRRILLGAVRRKPAVNLEHLAAEIGQPVSRLKSAMLGLQSEGLVRQKEQEKSVVWIERSPGSTTNEVSFLAQTT